MQRFRQHRDERRPQGRGDQRRDLLRSPALHEAGGHQLFQNGGAGGRGADAFPLGVIGHILCPCRFHRAEDRVLGVVLGRRGLPLLDSGGGDGDGLPLGQLRQGVFLLLRFIDLPAWNEDGLALGGEAVTAAVQGHSGFRIAVRRRYGFEQAPRRELQNLPFPQGQGVQIGCPGADRGNDGMVVADLFAAAHLGGVDFHQRVRATEGSGSGNIRRNTRRHIVGEIAAVCPGIGAELFLIEGLQIVQRLLGGVAQDAVGVPLEGGQIVEGRGLF